MHKRDIPHRTAQTGQAQKHLDIVRTKILSGVLVGAALITGCSSLPSSTSTVAIEAPIRLAVAGDVGSGGTTPFEIGARINSSEAVSEYDALLLLGDNVYPNGDPEELAAKVFEPFDPVLDGGTELLAVLGNHDVRDDNGDAQAAALGMPGRWYATTIDDVLIVALDTTVDIEPDQIDWLEQTLSASDAKWKIAMMHHPAYSAGFHGSTDDVQATFSPLFERYGVQLALAGHDHDYQRTEPLNHVTYVVSGAAAKLRPAGWAPFSEVSLSVNHFLDIAIWSDRLVLRAIGADGVILDEVTLDERT